MYTGGVEGVEVTGSAFSAKGVEAADGVENLKFANTCVSTDRKVFASYSNACRGALFKMYDRREL